MTTVTTRGAGALAQMRNITPLAARPRRRPWTLRLWLPVSLLFLLLAPLAVAALPLLWLAAPLGRRNWAPALFYAGGAMLALHGTRIEVRTSDLTLSIALF